MKGPELRSQVYGPLTRTDIVRYAGASGDFHPLHHDDEIARASGAPSVFAMGMLQASILASYAAEQLGAEGWTRYAVRFVAKVWPGDVLTCSGRITFSDDGASRQAELTCVNQSGDVILTAVAELSDPAPS